MNSSSRQLTVITLHVAILPGTDFLDVGLADIRTFQPTLQFLRDDPRTVVALCMIRFAANKNKLLQRQHHIPGREGPLNFCGQAFPDELVKHRQGLQLPSSFRPVHQYACITRAVTRARRS